jgi:iron only hydrogenase large subunit-like protein
VVVGKPCPSVDFKDVRGVEGIKEAEYDLKGTKVKVAVTSGLNNAAKLLDMIKSGEKDYTFVEVMCCPGGCVNGGGQPHQPGYIRNYTDLRAERAKALYSEDAGMELRKSHENPKSRRCTRISWASPTVIRPTSSCTPSTPREAFINSTVVLSAPRPLTGGHFYSGRLPGEEILVLTPVRVA